MTPWDPTTADGRIYSGRWRPGGGGVREVVSPGSGAVIGRIGVADQTDVARAGRAAAAAQRRWGAASYRDRAGVLARAAAALREMRSDVEQMIVRESGSLPSKAHYEVDKAVAELEAAVGLVTASQGDILPVDDPATLGLARRVPVGVVGVITPWNAPLTLGIRSVAPAIALGNAVLLKPDPKTPFSGGAAIAEVLQLAGLPKDLLHVLPGGADVGEAVVRCPDTSVISFTGSSAAGRQVGAIAGGLLKRLILELGGNNAIVVMADADLDRAVDCALAGAYRHQGQVCMATGRHLVHESIADEYERRLVEAVRTMVPTDPLAAGATMGPLITSAQAERVHDIVERTVSQGARVLTGGTHEGNLYQPTVLADVDPASPAFTHEIFGPVAPVTRFATVEEALQLAGATDYGLSAAIHTSDAAAGLAFASQLRVGMVAINGRTNYDAPHIPMGGMGASGNGSRHGGRWDLEELTFVQWVTMPAS
ncbi:aldehyde dehydrogenase family protein [Microbacterium sp.]|uniref:aldehyde dehydrogenase family protein n=1 Tax=Microbacterium sp. TaxID=51671 RepID=UPI003A87DB7F